MQTLHEFKGMFRFDPESAFKVGIERECFLARDGKIVPIAPQVLSYLKVNCSGRSDCFGYELSACQLEERTNRPCSEKAVYELLKANERDMIAAETDIGFSRIYCGTGPEDMPLDHYPCERYDQIVATMPKEVLMAACRVTGVHVHVGMPDHQTAMKVYDGVVDYFPMLCTVGCVHFDNRMDNYQLVVDGFGRKQIQSDRIRLFVKYLTNGGISCPPKYGSWEAFFQRALRENFATDPRRLWDFIRISSHGTIEFRMFDSTSDLKQIQVWATLCKSLCRTIYLQSM